jgi:hypothetical protein
VHKFVKRNWWRLCVSVQVEKEPSLPSLKGGRGGTVSKVASFMRRFKTPIAMYVANDILAISSRRSGSRHLASASVSSHGPLTACVDACCWRAQ